MSASRDYPDRPYLAVSAAIVHDDRVLIVRRARPPAQGLYTLPGGVVEPGEALHEAIAREVAEETGYAIEPVALAGYREAIAHDAGGRVRRHFVILAFAARLRGGELTLNDELMEARWCKLEDLSGLQTTEGLAEIVAEAFKALGH